MRLASALGAVLLAPLTFRALLIAERTQGVAVEDLRGLASDLGISLLFATALIAAGKRSRVLGGALLVVWVAGHYANYEVVSALGSMASVLDAHFLARPAFLFGSALAISRPIVLMVLIAASVALAQVARPGTLRAAVRCAVAAAVVLALMILWPRTYEASPWRQTHFLHQDAERLIQRVVAPDAAATSFRDAPAAMLDLLPELKGDNSGTPRFPLPGRARNVLLVILESVSGLHMQSLSRDHGVEMASLMPELDAIAKRNTSYSTFFVHQRRTNKGLYSILCGELPNLMDGLPKMSAYTEGGRACLPDILAGAGYHTAYLQAAPLAFMLKDQFMPRAGFLEVRGDEFFRGGYERTAWGLDDRAFLEQSLSRIGELHRQEQPFFVTLLSVGTHHPYVVPESYRPRMASEIARSLAYADEAVGEFHRALEAAGVLEDTLVLYTSDESVGFDGVITKLDQMIVKGWGFLIVSSPEKLHTRVREPFAQMDLAGSVVDYLELGDRGSHFFGRSVFRSYGRPRYLFFSNSNSDFNAVVHPDGHLAMCMRNFASCRAYAVPGGNVFGRKRRQINWDPATDGILEAMAKRSLVPTRGIEESRTFALIGAQRDFSVNRSELSMLHGGQYVTLGKDDWIEVELEIEAHGEGQVEIDHNLQFPGQRPYRDQATLAGGQTLWWHYTFAPGTPVPDLDARTRARLVRGSDMKLRFKTAKLTVHRDGDAPDTGLKVERLEVE